MYFELIIPQFIKTLQNLSTFMDKGAQFAETKKFDVNVFLNMRLAPDQLPFSKQIHIACDAAKLGVSRLTGKDAPVNADDEKTWADFKTRIDSTVAYLQKFNEKDFAEAATRKITQPRWEGKYLTGQEYLIQHMTPNFYFHVTTAYSILRHNGVDLGKKDFLGALPYKH